MGLQLARELASLKCHLIITARSQEELATAAGELTASGTSVRTIVCDLADPEQVQP